LIAHGDARPGFPFGFACKRSGNCCSIPGGFVRATEAECAAIANHLGMPVAAFQSRFLQPDGATLKDGLGGRCVFLQAGRTAGCSIYGLRPQQCREWPFLPKILLENELLAMVRRTCPGIVDL
jgi:hypothetical protein